MMAEFVLVFAVGHVLGDFYFQTERMARAKDKLFVWVCLHSMVYFLAMLAVSIPVMKSEMVLAVFCISVTHFLIDAVKFLLIRKKIVRRSGMLFVWNQVLHIITILAASYIMYSRNIELTALASADKVFFAFGIDKPMLARWILALLLIHVPSNVLIQRLFSNYKPKDTPSGVIVADNKAGRRIGSLERLIMLMFISMDQYAAMGLVLTAKSIARYEKISKDERFAEYYLMGTLLSTACVVACKMLILQ